MLIWGTRLKKKRFIGYRYCQNCGDLEEKYLMLTYKYIWFLIVPIAVYKFKYYIGCGECETGAAITKAGYKQMMMDYKTFPEKIKVEAAIVYIKGSLGQKNDQELLEILMKNFSFENFQEDAEYLISIIRQMDQIDQEDEL